MKPSDLKRTKARIEAAFADTAHPDEGEIACDCRSSSCEGLAMEADFRPYTWQNVPSELVDKYAQSLPIFTDQGYVYYLPAYMMRALDEPDGEVWEAVILALPGGSGGASIIPALPGDSQAHDLNMLQKVSQLLEEHEEARLHDFSDRQIEAIIEFIECLVANPSERTEDFLEDLFNRAESMDAYLRARANN